MRPLRLLFALTAVALAAAGGAGVAAAQVVSRYVEQPGPNAARDALVREAVVEERLGERVSLDTRFVDASGREVRVGDVLDEGRPVVLAFVYHSCPMLCSVILDGYAKALRESDLVPGRDYEAVALSFDPRDTPQRAAEAKARYLGVAGDRPGLAEHWHFWTGREGDVRRLADEVGFGYRWDGVQGEFAHQAALVVLSPDGTVARYLYGVSYPARDFGFAVAEADAGRAGGALERLLLSCYQYDPHRQTYTLALQRVMKAGGALALVALAAVLVPLWRRERRRRAPGDAAA